VNHGRGYATQRANFAHVETTAIDRTAVEYGLDRRMRDQRGLGAGMLDQVHQQFIDAVKAGRGKRLKETPELFSGLFWTGQQAIDLGLADQLGNIDFVAREIVKAEDLVDYTRRDNVAERLAKKFGAAIGEGAIHALHALPALR